MQEERVPHLNQSLYEHGKITATAASLLIMAFTLSSIFRLFGAEPAKAPYEVKDIYREMREMVFQLKPNDVAETDDSKVLAVIMDSGLENAAYTLVATVDGSASLYFSNGGGIIGGGGHAEGEEAAKALVAEAAKHLTKMTATKETPFIQPSNTAFYIVTGMGILTATGKTDDFGDGKLALSPLFYQAHELIRVIRVIDEAKSNK